MATPHEKVVAAGRELAVSNPQKVLFPAVGHTKLDLVRYYLAVAAGALRGASVKKLETEAKRERRQTARAADASRAAPAPVRQPDLFG